MAFVCNNDLRALAHMRDCILFGSKGPKSHNDRPPPPLSSLLLPVFPGDSVINLQCVKWRCWMWGAELKFLPLDVSQHLFSSDSPLWIINSLQYEFVLWPGALESARGLL